MKHSSKLTLVGMVLVMVVLLHVAAVAGWCQDATSRARAGKTTVLGTKAAGMGGAFVAVADDGTALYWNPAALARHRGFRTYSSIGAGSENVDTIEDLLDVADILDSEDGPLALGDFRTLSDTAQRNDEVPVEGDVAYFAGLEWDSWAAGAFAIVGGDAVLDYSTVPGVSERVDFMGGGGGQGGAGLAWGTQLTGDLDVGITARMAATAVGRADGYATYTLGEDQAQLTNPEGDTDTDNALTADVGLMYSPNERSRLGLVARNVTGPSFDLILEGVEGTTPVARTIDPSYDLGYACMADDGSVFAVDLHNVTEENGEGQDTAVGIEKPLGSSVLLRLGYGDSEPTVGLGLRWGSFRLEFASGLDWHDRAVIAGSAEF